MLLAADEWFAAVSISKMRCRNDAQGCREHLDGSEHANLFRACPDVIHRKDHHPGIGNALAKTDQDIAQKQLPHRPIEFAQASPEIPTLDFLNFILWLFAQLPLHENCGRGEQD